mmetsp:Transcript_33330/g.95788  ORF Transcript_33330/g.95788 Transcript_33330/m.95788 type:complete len:317 (+) Transcript_33330:68-1018(+)
MAARTTNASTSRSRRSGVGSTKHQTPRSCEDSYLTATAHSLSPSSRSLKPLLLFTVLSSFATLTVSERSGAFLPAPSAAVSCRRPRFCRGGSSEIREGIFTPLERSRSKTGRPPGFVAPRTKPRQLSFMSSLACSTSSSSKSREIMISSSWACSFARTSFLQSASAALFSMASTAARSRTAGDPKKTATARSASSRRCCRLWSRSCFSASVMADASMLHFLAVVMASFMAIVLPRFRDLPLLFSVSFTVRLYSSSLPLSSEDSSTWSSSSLEPPSEPSSSEASPSGRSSAPLAFFTSAHLAQTVPMARRLEARTAA